MNEARATPGTDDTDPVIAVERAYRLILGRPADTEGAAGYVRAVRSGELSVPEVCARLASSPEFAGRLAADGVPPGPCESAREDAGEGGAHEPEPVDVAELIETTTVEELAARADTYFRTAEDPETLLAKPFSGATETPELLATFAQVLRGLRPLPGMRVLDFGAGTCWTSRCLAQLGCRVTAMDVSPAALDLGRQLLERLPLCGRVPEPEFLVFDGRRIDLPEASVDRVLCYDALHHVPNPAEVLAELARVLRPGGIAAFAEPGHRHSVQPQSQYEMRNHGIIENDVVIEDIWRLAREVGFTDLRLCLLDSAPEWVDLQTFNDVVRGRGGAEAFLEPARTAIGDRRMFRLRRDGVEVPDSRAADGLTGELALSDVQVDRSGPSPVVTGCCRVHNPGPHTWLPSDAEFGPVRLGVRLHLAGDGMRDLTRIPLPGKGIPAGGGAEVAVRVELDPHHDGAEAVEFDLVSEGVCWFSTNGAPVARVPLATTPQR